MSLVIFTAVGIPAGADAPAPSRTKGGCISNLTDGHAFTPVDPSRRQAHRSWAWRAGRGQPRRRGCTKWLGACGGQNVRERERERESDIQFQFNRARVGGSCFIPQIGGVASRGFHDKGGWRRKAQPGVGKAGGGNRVGRLSTSIAKNVSGFLEDGGQPKDCANFLGVTW